MRHGTGEFAGPIRVARSRDCSRRMIRLVQPELLDVLPTNDPKAIHSRKDIARLNAIMGHAKIIASALKPLADKNTPLRIIELGAGDGTLLLDVARRIGRRTPATPIEAVLVDQQKLLRPETEHSFHELNWRIQTAITDVFEFLKNPAASANVIIANLFLHHFEDEPLKDLLRLSSQRAPCFVAVEPRRTSLALFASRLVGWIGCNSVTRHDAAVSVQAGFNERELSGFWPRGQHWDFTERPAGFASHLFTAQKRK